jgi:AraC-like DNA-binding protein
MIYPSEADIVPAVKHLVEGLKPYAQANKVTVSFHTNVNELVTQYQPSHLIQSLSHVICHIISLIPPESRVEVRLYSCPENKQLAIEVENSGINLIPVNGIPLGSVYTFESHPLDDGTIYRLTLPVNSKSFDNKHIYSQNKPDANDLPQFYAEIRKRLKSHFTQAEKLVAALSRTRPAEASFLQKINVLIQANLEKEDFDTNTLCKAMGMSRTQLFRRLKPLIRQAPANYIKTMRLQKAKELLETTDVTVSEVAFKTGFQTVSHFTKIFQKQYDVLPSTFKRNNNATNK